MQVRGAPAPSLEVRSLGEMRGEVLPVGIPAGFSPLLSTPVWQLPSCACPVGSWVLYLKPSFPPHKARPSVLMRIEVSSHLPTPPLARAPAAHWVMWNCTENSLSHHLCQWSSPIVFGRSLFSLLRFQGLLPAWLIPLGTSYSRHSYSHCLWPCTLKCRALPQSREWILAGLPGSGSRTPPAAAAGLSPVPCLLKPGCSAVKWAWPVDPSHRTDVRTEWGGEAELTLAEYWVVNCHTLPALKVT